jgi:AraC-like DNA-binding protein
MARKTSAETSHIWRMPHLGNLELLHARYITQTFSPHFHDQYAIGVIEAGALGFYYRGQNVVAPQGNISLCIPGEIHTGHALADHGWTYRMFYFDPALLQQIAADIAHHPQGLPFFKTGVIHDNELARLIRRLHVSLEQQAAPLIEQESAWLEMLAQMILRHADATPVLGQVKKEPLAVKQVRQYIETYYADDFSIDDLARLTFLSPFHLIRVFKAETGLPPYAFLRQVRVKRAKELLARGESIAQAAQATGFTDQSHLHRWFKGLWGITPGQYRNSLQYS